MTEQKATREIPVLPLRGMLVFPYMVVHLDVGRERSINAIDEALLTEGKQIFLVMQKDAQTDEPKLDDLYEIGTVAEIKQLLKLPGGTIRVLAEGLYRARLCSFIQTDPLLLGEVVEEKETEDVIDLAMEALARNLQEKFADYAKVNKKIATDVVNNVAAIGEPAKVADTIAAYLNVKLADRQLLLETISLEERLNSLIEMLNKEIQIIELDRRINTRVRAQMEKNQKDYYLREQMKAIQQELGEKDDRLAEVEELREQAKKAKLPKEAAEKVKRELDRLEKMPPMVAEAMVVRNYVEWILDLPWKKETKDRLDIKVAEQILNEEHYGLEDAKERILEYLAARQLSKDMKGPILCLVGPPGVGKTSLAQSVAKSLQKKFVRISLGGVRDEAEIRGHRRTYIGSMPGRIIQGMKKAGCLNPVFLLDEIDKMSNDFRGDPASALLEVLDQEQNNTFSDHYIEINYDLSKVLFITTANVRHNIPQPLLDRMEIIEINSYTEEEKLQIAQRHLLKKQCMEHGLKDGQLQISENALRAVIRNYTREAGVRSLERTIAKICRKVGREIVGGNTGPFKISSQNIEQYLGIPRYHHAMAEQTDQVGVATGLAWTEVGGDVLSIEVQVLKGKGKMTLTGQLGDVMKESAQAGFTYIRSQSDKLGITSEVDEKNDIHIHVPEGAIPKDGPSAGITIATALASALTGRAVRHDLAMTGEITLRGRVLPVGGIKEKVLAAQRAGCKVILLPKENKKDLEEIPAAIRKKLEFHLVEHMDEVLDLALLPQMKKDGIENHAN